MKPQFCPYCGEKQLEELEPTEVMMENDVWTIHHYECQFCGELFDKIVPEGEDEWGGLVDMDENDIEEMLLNIEDEDKEGYEH